MSFSLFEKKDEASLLIDIGNGSIGSALVLCKENSKPVVLHSVRKSFSISGESFENRIVEEMLKTLDESLKDLMKYNFKADHLKKTFNGILISFSSPWFILQSKDIHLEQDKTFIITQSFVDDVLTKEEMMFKKELLEQSKKNGLNEKYVIVDKNIVHCKLNGYTLRINIGKKTKAFDAFLCLSAIPEITLNKIISTVHRYTNTDEEKISIHAFPLVSFLVIKDIFHYEDNFLIMDVAGETTDITLISDGTLKKTMSFPLGRNFIIRQITKKFDCSPQIAESMLHMFNSGEADEPVSKSIEEVLANIETEWAIYIEDTLATLSPQMILPPNVYLTVDTDVSKFFIDSLKLPKSDRTSLFRKNIQVVHMNSELMTHVTEKNPLAPQDEFIDILALFFSKFLNK
ncbi:MAG: hypothetical protein WCK48_02630 [bacterium]